MITVLSNRKKPKGVIYVQNAIVYKPNLGLLNICTTLANGRTDTEVLRDLLKITRRYTGLIGEVKTVPLFLES
jgi:hypothetical protein